ncbi:MAG: hypothetical protein ABGW87_06485 [Sphingomonadaceae bacterium]
MVIAFSERSAWQRVAIIAGWLLVIIAVGWSMFGGGESHAFVDGPDELRPGGDQYSVLINPTATSVSLATAAKKFCNDKSLCQVMGWREAANRAHAIPMLRRESDAVSFVYMVDRTRDSEIAMWDCKVWPGKGTECLDDIGISAPKSAN